MGTRLSGPLGPKSHTILPEVSVQYAPPDITSTDGAISLEAGTHGVIQV